jgi:hypothetical protein
LSEESVPKKSSQREIYGRDLPPNADFDNDMKILQSLSHTYQYMKMFEEKTGREPNKHPFNKESFYNLIRRSNNRRLHLKPEVTGIKRSRVFLCQLPPDISVMDIVLRFNDFKPKDVSITSNHGTAFVGFDSLEDAQKALEVV